MASKKPQSDLAVVGDHSDISAIGSGISILGNKMTVYPSDQTTRADKYATHDQNLVEHTPRFGESPLDFIRDIGLHVSGTGWRSYNKIIGQPIYYSGFTENMINAVMSNPLLKSKISDLAEKRVAVEDGQGLFGPPGLLEDKRKARRRAEIQSNLEEVAAKMTDDMVCKLESKPFIRGAYYMATALLTQAYHQGIHVSSEEVLRLRAVAEKAEKNNHSIIFLPCHRSHIDYISLQLICYRLGLALPTVVAGDNLNFPLVGPFLQHAGAMWIRRSFGDDQLYVTLVQAYIDTLLQKGFNFECFIEGGRSRIGKLLPPKFGILSFLLDSVLSGRVDDAIICPVSTQYDKVIEVDSYIRELLGTPKAKENLTGFLSARSVLSSKLGRVDVRFHAPWSLRGFIQQQRSRLDALPMEQQAELQKSYYFNLRIRLLRTLGYKVLSDINDVSVVMPTSLIGTVLLTLRGQGVGKTELIRRVEWLSERVRAQGGRVAHFAGIPTSVVVERGLEVLGANLVGTHTGLAEDTYYAVDRFQLSFYRNMTIHLFINQALVAASMYTRIKAGGSPDEQNMTYAALSAHVSFLSQLFRGEFVFPTAGLTANLAQTVLALEADGVVQVSRGGRNAVAPPEHPTATEIQDVDTVALSAVERESGRENFDFYCFLIWPFIEASWLGAISLLMLTPPPAPSDSPSAPSSPSAAHDSKIWLDFPRFQASAQLLGKTLHAQGDVAYLEAVNKETLKNAYDRFEEEGIIEIRAASKRTGVPAGVRLTDAWTPRRDARGSLGAAGRLWDFCEQVSRARVEGKNRRDGDAVVGRVLRLVDVVSGDVWATARSAAAAVGQAGEQGQQGQGQGQQGLSVEREEEKLRMRRKRRNLKEAGEAVKANL